MPRIAVYRFLLRDPVTGAWVKQPVRATRARIEALGGAPLFDTKVEVDPGRVAGDGTCALARPVAKA
jgi:hypothetical protein